MLLNIILILLAIYLVGEALCAAQNREHIEGGWLRVLGAALSWPAVLVALFLAWRRD